MGFWSFSQWQVADVMHAVKISFSFGWHKRYLRGSFSSERHEYNSMALSSDAVIIPMKCPSPPYGQAQKS